MSLRAFATIAVALGASGCFSEITDTSRLPTRDPSAATPATPAPPTIDTALVLDLVNHPGTTAAVLDNDVGLDARVATRIAERRDGPDGEIPSADDDWFDDLAELDAVAYVGPHELALLEAFARAHPAPAAVEVHGVSLLGWESEAVVWGVNQATVEELDEAVGLGSRAASALVAERPFVTVAALAAAAGLDAPSIDALRAYAGVWWDARLAPPPPDTETIDGVEFDRETASIALDIANRATHDDLVAAGIWSSTAARLIAARSYASLHEVARVQGVGPATMTALRDYARSGTWTRGPDSI